MIPELGTMIVQAAAESSLPLEHTDVVAQVTGPIANVSVTQRFGNPFDQPIELLYLFPLPHEAAVTSFELKAGGRTIVSRVEEADAARRTYESARDRGQRAGLVEERRANLFSLEIANVQPHETIVATVRYQERIRFDDGNYSFVFPMGITPKYHKDPAEAVKTDAPVAKSGSPIGIAAVQVSIDAGVAAGDPVSPSHAIDVTRLDERRMNVRTAGEIIPNKDFVLRYRVASEDIRTAVWLAHANGGTTLLLTAIPPRLESDAEPSPREFIFVIDRSGSMSVKPMAQARNALRACIRSLSTKDTFAILAFDDRLDWYKPQSSAVSQKMIDDADRWIRTIQSRGGTEIGAALEAALKLPHDRERQRYIVFLTDGAVSAEREVISAVRSRIGSGRLFTFGIGASVNRALLAGMANEGRGVAEFLQEDEDIEEALIRFQDRVAYPAMQDVRVEWSEATAWDVYPNVLPDLYHGQALEMTARVKTTGSHAKAIISGTRDGKEWRAELALPEGANEPAVARIWAKARVDALLAEIDSRANVSMHRSEIIELAIEHHLATRFTSLVAVDEQPAGGGESKQVRVAVPMPEAVVMDWMVAAPAAAMPAFAAGMLGKITRSAAQAPPPPPAFEECLSEDEDPLRRLARTQNVDGSWGTGDERIEKTAAAILEFVRQGHTTKSGHYRRQIARAVKWLRAANAEGAAGVAKERALAELERASS